MTRIPDLVAHRGYMELYPENTLAALEAALQAGACYIEFDVQMTADKKFIVMHDDNFNRTAGINKNVFNMTLAQARAISVHEPERLGDQFSGTNAPSLEQAIGLIQKYPKARAFVEIKDESLEQWGIEYIVDRLLAAIGPYANQCILISFNSDAIKYATGQSDVLTGWVLTKFDDKHKSMADAICPNYLLCNYRKISDQQKLWTGNWQWLLYDITDPELALNWNERGAGLIETRDVGSMLQHEVLSRAACKHDG